MWFWSTVICYFSGNLKCSKVKVTLIKSALLWRKRWLGSTASVAKISKPTWPTIWRNFWTMKSRYIVNLYLFSLITLLVRFRLCSFFYLVLCYSWSNTGKLSCPKQNQSHKKPFQDDSIKRVKCGAFHSMETKNVHSYLSLLSYHMIVFGIGTLRLYLKLGACFGSALELDALFIFVKFYAITQQ